MILFYSVSCSNCPIFLHDEVQHGSLSSSFAATYDQGSLPFGPEAAHADGPMVQQRPGKLDLPIPTEHNQQSDCLFALAVPEKGSTTSVIEYSAKLFI